MQLALERKTRLKAQRSRDRNNRAILEYKIDNEVQDRKTESKSESKESLDSADIGEHTTLGSNNALLGQCTMEQLKVWLLEQSFGRSLWIGRVGDNDIEAVLVILKKLESVSNVDLNLGVLVTDGHAGEVLLGETDNGL